jgi:hypothetical protein
MSKSIYVGLRINNSLVYSNDISGTTGASLVFATHATAKRRISFDFGLGYSPMSLESELSKSIDGYLEGHIGLQRRIYSTPDHTWMGLFLFFGFDVRFITWTYKNPLRTDVFDEYGNFVRTDNIHSDGLNGLGLHLGGGWSFLQTKYCKLSAELSLVGALYGLETWESFDNDVFPGSGQIRLTIEAILGINK